MSNVTYLCYTNTTDPAIRCVKALEPYDIYVTRDEFKPILGTLEQLKNEYRSLGYEIQHITSGDDYIEIIGNELYEPEEIQIWILEKVEIAS